MQRSGGKNFAAGFELEKIFFRRERVRDRGFARRRGAPRKIRRRPSREFFRRKRSRARRFGPALRRVSRFGTAPRQKASAARIPLPAASKTRGRRRSRFRPNRERTRADPPCGKFFRARFLRRRRCFLPARGFSARPAAERDAGAFPRRRAALSSASPRRRTRGRDACAAPPTGFPQERRKILPNRTKTRVARSGRDSAPVGENGAGAFPRGGRKFRERRGGDFPARREKFFGNRAGQGRNGFLRGEGRRRGNVGRIHRTMRKINSRASRRQAGSASRDGGVPAFFSASRKVPR